MILQRPTSQADDRKLSAEHGRLEAIGHIAIAELDQQTSTY